MCIRDRVNGHPDLTGYWAGNQGAFFTEQKNDGDVPNVHFINRTNDGSIFYDYAGAEGSVGQSAHNPARRRSSSFS